MQVSNNTDFHIPIGSLPLHFRKELNDFKKSSKGWIKADPERVQKIQKNIIQNKSKKVIGKLKNYIFINSLSPKKY